MVLGGGRDRNAPEYGKDTVSEGALVRLRYAARLHKRTDLPLLVTGGIVIEGEGTEAELMREVMEESFRIPVTWVEGESHNTWENALFSGNILKREGISRVLLVTHAWHQPRALVAFVQQGLEPIAAPTAFSSNPQPEPIRFADWLPDAGSLNSTAKALHEYIGLNWYRVRCFGRGGSG